MDPRLELSVLQSVAIHQGGKPGVHQRDLEARNLMGAIHRLERARCVARHGPRFVITGPGRRRLYDLCNQMARVAIDRRFGYPGPLPALSFLRALAAAFPLTTKGT